MLLSFPNKPHHPNFWSRTKQTGILKNTPLSSDFKTPVICMMLVI